MPDNVPPSTKRFNMDQAISKTKFGLFNYVIIFLSGLILYAVVLETCAILYVMPVSQCDLNLTTSQKGILAAAAFSGVICSSHLWGFLADTQGRRKVIQPTLFTAVLLSICCSFIQNFNIFVILRFLNGFFMSGSAANIYVYLGEFHNNNQRSRAIMGAAIVFSTLCMMMPLGAWAVVNEDWQFYIPLIDLTYKPWRLFLVVCGIPGLLSATALIFLPESPKFVLGQGNGLKSYNILQKMNRWNNGKRSEFELFEIYEEPESIENRKRIAENKNSRFPFLKTVWNQTAPLFKPPYLKSTILLCTIQFGTYSTSNGFFMFFAEILNKMSANLDNFTDQRMMMCDIINMKPNNASTIALNNTSSEVCINKLELSTLENGVILEMIFAIGSAVSGLLINRIAKFPIIFSILVSTGLCGIGCMITNIPAVQISLFVVHLSCCIAPNVVSAATIDLYPTTLRAMALSISLMFGRLGGVAGSNVAAHLLDNHCEATFYLSSCVLLAMAVLAFFVPNIHKRVSKSTQEKTNDGHRISVITFRGSVTNFNSF